MARPKHRTQPGATYFVTTDTWQRRALFQNPALASVLEDALFHYRDQGNYKVHRHVVMPDHFHAILTPGESTTLEKSMQLIKGGSSHRIGQSLGTRFPVWHAGFTEHQIRNQRDFESHAKYIDENPVKAGLSPTPAEYPHSSAAGKFPLDLWPSVSGAKAPEERTARAAGFKPRPSDSQTKASPQD